MISSVPTLGHMKFCLEVLNHESDLQQVHSLRYYAAQAHAFDLACQGIASTDWKIVLVSLDIFYHFTKLKKTDKFPEHVVGLVSLNAYVRQDRLRELCTQVESSKLDYDIAFFVAAAIRSRRDWDWSRMSSLSNLLKELLKKGYGFEAIEEAALSDVWRSPLTAQQASFETLGTLVEFNYASEVMVNALIGCLSNSKNLVHLYSVQEVLCELIKKNLFLDKVEQAVDNWVDDVHPMIRALGLGLLIDLLNQNRGVSIGERLTKKEFSTDKIELQSMLYVMAALVTNGAAIDLAKNIWKKYINDEQFFISLAAIEILYKLVNRGEELDEAEIAVCGCIVYHDRRVKNAALKLFMALFEKDRGWSTAERVVKDCLKTHMKTSTQRLGRKLLKILAKNNRCLDLAKFLTE